MTLNSSQNLIQLEKIISETDLVAMIRPEPADIISKLDTIEFKKSYDNLDYLIYALLSLPSGNRVALVRHQHSPDPGLEICVQHDRGEIAKIISETLERLDLNRQDLTWIHPKYEEQFNRLIKEYLTT
jgi:hypothetical protein